jgi:hypothetical protein
VRVRVRVRVRVISRVAGAGGAERPSRTRGVVAVAAGTHAAARVALIRLHALKLGAHRGILTRTFVTAGK